MRGPSQLPAKDSHWGRVAAPGTALYVHVPFCLLKCTYCDFYSLPAEGLDLGEGVDAILAEAAQRCPAPEGALSPDTVFVGGGTPSMLEARDLERLLDGLDRITGYRRSASEVTLECNPESLDQQQARLLVELGVTRLSIGLQSLRPQTLRLFGRTHTVEQGFAAYQAARDAGAQQVSVDMIYAAQGEDPDGWSRDLERVLELGPDHLSAYELTFEQDTPLARDVARGRVQAACEEASLEYLGLTRAILAERGYHAYEISNHARVVPGADGPPGPRPDARCRHNLNYWANGPYLGLGPSAVSKLGHERLGNPRHLNAWIDLVAGKGFAGAAPAEGSARELPRGPRQSARAWREQLPSLERLGETWWLGLRTSRGVAASEARARSGWSPGPDGEPDPAEALAHELQADGLLVRRGPRWALSQNGLPLADGIGARFLERCSSAATPAAVD